MACSICKAKRHTKKNCLQTKGIVYPSDDLNLKSRYQHNACSNCVYLGRFEEYDLYYCEGTFTKTVLARFSDEASHYLSGWGSRTSFR